MCAMSFAQRISSLAIFLFCGGCFGMASFRQNPPAKKSEQKIPPDSVSRKDAQAEMELQKALAAAGNDRVALVRSLKQYLVRFPDAPRKSGVYRALVEACQQLRDAPCALEYSERLIALHPDDDEMMMLTVNLLRDQGDDASLRRAAGYVSRVLDRIEKSPPEKSTRQSLADWQEQKDEVRATLYIVRGQIEKSQRDLGAAGKDLELSFSIVPSAAAAEQLGEIAELRKDPQDAVHEYILAFVLPPNGAGGNVDRREVRRKLGNVWWQVHGDNSGLGEALLAAYDKLETPLASGDTARNQGAKDVYDFVLRNLDGSPYPLEPLKGKVVALSFWATWCGPCRELEPIFAGVAQSYAQDPRVVFLAVNTDDDQALVSPFLAREKWKVGAVLADGLDDFMKVETLPTVMVLDPQGKVAYRAEGFSGDLRESLSAAIQAVVHLTPQNIPAGSR
jgi:thiol-disulfide isomerase/thioredoxin